MFPFWEVVVAPVLEAAGVRRLVEIGALRGENTQLMLDRLGGEAELHVIDPVPDFDPEEHARQFAGQYVFHRDLSLNVLGDLPPMDAALIDGDHNWYTVYNECKLLAAVAREAGAELPVLILHDVCWPYGRRDLYYDPSNIPAEFRQPYRRAGMRPGRKRLVAGRGGMNPTLCNAEVEGGRRNGVMTGLEDFMKEYDKPLRRVVVPIYFGLAIVVEEERLARQPALARELDRLESLAGKDQLLELAEDIYMDGMVFQHNILGVRDRTIDRLASRYLESVKRALLDEHYLENELRLAHLAESAAGGKAPDQNRLRDPVRFDAESFRALQERRRLGADSETEQYAYATGGRVALDLLHAALDGAHEDGEPGDFVVTGVNKGGDAIFCRAYAEACELNHTQVWVADRFADTDLNRVRDAFERFDLLDDRVHFVQGDLGASLPDAPIEQVAALVLGRGLGATARTVLDAVYPKLSPGGAVVVDTRDAALAEAVAAFRTANRIDAIEVRAGSAAYWQKDADDAVGVVGTEPAGDDGLAYAPLARPVSTTACDLSVVIVVHNMPREAARSLLALSRWYQQGIEDLDYEVIVVENGSAPDQCLGEEFVRGFGKEFRYLDLGRDASPSPAHALNAGIAASNGRNLALMIDGAHVVTPGVLRHGMSGLATYEPAIVATQQWYVGPGQQGDAMRNGYDEAYEDQLFEQIDWPNDGYGLFRIGHFIADRDWFDGMWESNCLFVARKQLEQVGGFDEGFTTPGGGYTNLDLFERLASAPDISVVTILGEGSFHQVHGGTTTNQPDPAGRRARVVESTSEYRAVRGRPFKGPTKVMHFVGAFPAEAAKRSRARRMTAWAFPVDDRLEGASEPVAVPDEIRDGFVDAYWRSGAVERTSWLGRKLANAPTDLLVYQEIIEELRPDWIIETGTAEGGRAAFVASICDLLDHGRVVSVGSGKFRNPPPHPRVSYVVGRSSEKQTVEQVRDIVGDGSALVILGTRAGRHTTRAEFDAYKGFVGVGSYVIIEHTVLNGFPVDATHGPGPHEAVRWILNHAPDFVADTEREKFALTFNAGGFLRRIQ